MRFTIYSKNGCPYCTKIKQIMEGFNLEHKIYTLGEDFTREQFYEEFSSGSTFPQIILEDTGEHLGGCAETINYLREQKVI